MATRFRIHTVTGAALAMLVAAAPAAAQVFGTFAWQMQPYCNVVSLTLVNTPAGFTLHGTDDQCGAANKASAVGIASFNTSGNVTLNVSIVTAPSGKPVHVSALVSPTTGNGTWTDSVGNTGTFAMFATTPGLPPRPLPPSGVAAGSITAAEIAPGAVGNTAIAQDSITGINVRSGSLTSAHLFDAPRTSSDERAQSVALLLNTHTQVGQVAIEAPAEGHVIVTASAAIAAASAGDDLAECSLTRGQTVESAARTVVGENAALPASVFFPLALTRGFTVNSGFLTFRLVCREITGAIVVFDTAITAMYVRR